MDPLEGMSTTYNSDGQNRTSIFNIHQYPPPMRPPPHWNEGPRIHQSPNSGMPFIPGFDMQTNGASLPPNFQFGNNRLNFGQMVQFPFPAKSCDDSMENNIKSSMRCKRKTDSPPLQKAKQFITEEKMSEHLSKLHISSETVSEMESEDTKEKRLYMCDEMKKFQAESEHLLPQSLLHKLSSPCTDVVLWRPPGRLYVPNEFNYIEYEVDDSYSGNNNNNVQQGCYFDIGVEQRRDSASGNDMECEEL